MPAEKEKLKGEYTGRWNARFTITLINNKKKRIYKRGFKSKKEALEYEKNMFYFNMEMTGIETIFFLAKPELEPLNSTRMRELHAFGQDVSAWVPENVSRELRKLDEKK